MNSPPTSPEYSIYHLPQQAKTRTENCTSIKNSSIYYLHHQYQQAECRTISTIAPNSTTSTLYHQNPADKTEITTNTTSTSITLDSNELTPLTPTNSSTLNSSETIPLSPATTHTNLNSNELIPIPPTSASASAFFSSSNPDTLADAVPPLSLPISSTPPPPLTLNSPPARQLNPADIRPLLETIDRTALPPAYPQPLLSRIEAAEVLLEIRYGRRERSREGTMEPELELARSSSRPIVVLQADDRICGEGADKEGPRGGALWGSRLRAKTKRNVKLTA